jgi:1-pyrroline-5-carboxylate dehydrogenase
MERLYAEQPESAEGMWNRLEHRPLDGYVFAVSPFNFTSIGGNLPGAPAMLGNTCLWKPASTSVLSNYYVMKLMMEAGLPPGVINFIPGSGAEVGEPALAHPALAGVHFTGSTAVFQGMWQTIGTNIRRYRQYPRIVGETGGKDFIFAHPSADRQALAVAMVRGSFEYQGQKCSAASRAYVPKSMWGSVKDRIQGMLAEISIGDPADFRNFMGAVIDKTSFEKLKGAIEEAKESPDAEVVLGGECDDTKGWFIRPTVIEVSDPRYRTMCEELFGPILTVFVYDDGKYEETLDICASSSPYALTGAIFSQDRTALRTAFTALRYAAGNFYINDKPTGAVVGQQPFGGSRASGTNDKAGSLLNLLRWVSPRTVKETFEPPHDYRYPFMADE